MMMEGAFYAGGALLGYIPDQMGPINRDRCNYLETCTRRQTVFGRQFPPGHYHYCSVPALTWY